MTEDEARAWAKENFGAAVYEQLERYVALLLAEAGQQNLISRSTLPQVWARHIVDSLQLISLAPSKGEWLDVGSGAGLPGIAVAIGRDRPTTLVEPRRKRAEFLSMLVVDLGLSDTSVVCTTAQTAPARRVNVVSARAVAPIEDLLRWTTHNVSRETVYVLPRGRSGLSDLALAQRTWQGTFHVEQSLTDPSAGIVVASNVQRR